MRYPSSYKVAGKEAKEFKELDDERALKLVVLIYNVKHESWEDGIARSVALQEYISLLAKRKSLYLRNSGVFDISYEKINLSTWKDEDLIKLYDTLEPKASTYYVDVAPELTEIQNAERIIYLTAESAVATEMKKRNNTRNAVTIATQILVGILTVALSII
ncbi:MAG: hypothetical protein Q8N91_07210 [Candidatus Omnitrophota bacterium]|nr:hypothetical protein [Candidatus Omnitrophota bacterium]